MIKSPTLPFISVIPMPENPIVAISLEPAPEISAGVCSATKLLKKWNKTVIRHG